MRNKKYFIVLFIFIAYAVYDFGGMAFTDGLYSPLVLYGCYIFLMADKMNELTAMSIYRYHSVKNLYIQYMKNQMMAACVYLAVFFAAGMITGVASAVFDREFFCIMRCNDKISDYQLCESAYHRIFAAGFKNFAGEKRRSRGISAVFVYLCIKIYGRQTVYPAIYTGYGIL